MGIRKELETRTDNGHEHLNRLTTLPTSPTTITRLITKGTVVRRTSVENVGECAEQSRRVG